jgi:hypothetical protein
MGYLTHVSLYNDGIDLLKTASEEESGATAKKFCLNLYRASQHASCYGRETTVPLDYFANFATVQIPVHADERTLYLNYGNCLIDLSPYHNKGRATLEQKEKYIKIAESLLKSLKADVKRMKEKAE